MGRAVRREVFRKALGGHWRLRLNDPKSPSWHPELWFLEEKDTPDCSHTLVTASSNRRTGKISSLVFNGAKECIGATAKTLTRFAPAWNAERIAW